MKRLFLFGFSVLLLVFSLAYPQPSFAQQKIAVRSGGHEEYSRVVFDWGKEVGFEIDQAQKDLLIIRFKEAGNVDLSGFDPSKLNNVTGFRVLKNDPLIVSMIVPEASKVKAFNLLRTRFVVDVYNPEKTETAKTEEKKPEPAPTQTESPPVPEKKPEPEKTETVKAEAPPPVPPVKKEDKAKVKEEPRADETKPEQKAAEPSKTAEKTQDKEDHKEEVAAEELPHSMPPGEYEAKGLKYSLVPETSALAKPPMINNEPAEPEKPKPEEPEKPQGEEKPHEAPQEKTLEKAANKHVPPQREVVPPVPEHNESISPVTVVQTKKDEEDKPHTAPAPKIQADTSSLHVLTVISTSSVGLAVFERAGQLWFVTDQEAQHLEPVVNSKTPTLFAPFVKNNITGGQTYITTYPPDYNVRGRGGELSWKIIFDKQEKQSNPIELERIARGGNFSRGGKVIWPVKDATSVLNVTDPLSGQAMKIVTVKNADQFSGPSRDFVDFTIMHSIVGIAIAAKVDDLQVELTEQGVEITRPGGLAVLPESVVSTAALDEQTLPIHRKGTTPTGPRIFNFGEWQRIPFEALDKNTNLVLAELPQYSKSGRAEDLIALAKAYLLSGMGAEAIGFLEFAGQEVPDMAKNPEYIALRGMANAFDGKTDVALAYLQRPELQKYEEVGYWKSYVLADLGDWQQAVNVLPSNLAPFYEYPGQVSRRLGLVLAEVLLRAGKIDKSDELLAMIEHYKTELDTPMEAALNYLRGESARQKGQRQKAVDTWRELEEGPDDLYRVKAGLAITRLLDEAGAIPLDKVIDRLERLRYAWRGDEIEALVDYWLGVAYFRKKEYVKGLTIMRDAAEVAGETELGRRVTADMRKAFTDLYMGPDLEKLSALDAVALYEQFRELSPPGEEGDKLARMLAEHLVKADLLGRAAAILENQVNNRLQGEDLIRVGKRLAVVYLLDRQPQKALRTLDKLENPIKLMPPGPEKDKTEYEMTLLQTRAYAQDNRAQQALNILKDMEPNPDVNRLRADISWQSGYWGEAADALNQILEDEVSGGIDLTDKQVQLMMNLAVALNLANDRIAIANLRKKYGELMAKTPKAQQFEVITRERRNSVLADRETLMSVVSEVDLFKEFLDAYKSDDTMVKPAEAAPVSH